MALSTRLYLHPRMLQVRMVVVLSTKWCHHQKTLEKDIKEIAHNGQPLGRFFFIEDPDGYKIEVLQRAGRFQ